MKELIWLSNTRKRLQELPEPARKRAGTELTALQLGKQPKDWRPMPNIGTGCIEIRIHEPNEYRIIYVATYPEGIYIIHVFEKKTQKTPLKHTEIARSNYDEIQKSRKQK